MEPVGGTPTGATGTVALSNSSGMDTVWIFLYVRV